MSWKWVTVVGLGDIVLGKGSIVRWSGGEDGVGAEVVRATPAVVAADLVSVNAIYTDRGSINILSAWHTGLDGNSIADPEILHGGPDLDHRP